MQLFHEGKVIGNLDVPISEFDHEKKGTIKLSCLALETF